MTATKQPNQNDNVTNIQAIVYVKSTDPDVKPIIPVKGTEFSHCFDLFVAEDFSIAPGDVKIVPTGLIMEIPKGYAGLIRERSSTIVKYDITVEAGDIDSDYRKGVGIVFHRKSAVGIIGAIQHVRAMKEFVIDEKLSFFTKLVKRLNPKRYFDMLKNAWSFFRRRNKIISFKRGNSLAQMEIVKVLPVGFAKVVAGQELSKTNRKGGFGSTTKSESENLKSNDELLVRKGW